MSELDYVDELHAEITRLDAEVIRLREAVTQYSEKDAWYVAEVKRLRIIETAAQLYGDYCRERHGQSDDCDMSFEEWLDWMLVDDILGKMMIHYDQETLDDMKSKATGRGWLLGGFFTNYSKLKEREEE